MRATGVRGHAFASAPEDGGGVKRGEEPKKRVDEIDPDSALHADDAFLSGRRVGSDEDLAKDAEEGDPEDAN